MSNESIRSRIVRVLEDYSGLRLASADMGAAFMDLGLDSLFLTQASQALSREFGVGVTFRQLNESLTSVDALYAHLVSQGITDSPQPDEPAPSIESPQIKAEPTIWTPATHSTVVPMLAPGNLGDSSTPPPMRPNRWPG